MALDIHMVQQGERADSGPPRLSLDDDGAFWFVCPYLERAGRRIDLYGDALFGPDELRVVRDALNRAREGLQDQPDRWEYGKAWSKGQGEVKRTANKTEVQAKLDALIALVDEAIEAGARLEFVGD